MEELGGDVVHAVGEGVGQAYRQMVASRRREFVAAQQERADDLERMEAEVAERGLPVRKRVVAVDALASSGDGRRDGLGGPGASPGNVYAIGDVAGGLQFTHVAGYHAGLVVRALLFRLPARENRSIIPWATFTDPELAHVGMTETEAVKAVFGRTAIERFDALGLLTNRLIAVHTNHATEQEYQRLLETGVHICHSPAHYGMLGESSTSETRQIARFLRDGAPVSCSTDGGITYIGGMAEAMRAAHLGHNEATNDNTTCPPTTALLTATRNGANALGWGDKIGSVEPGKQADLVLVDIDDWRYRIGNHPLRTFLIAGGSRDVNSVMVAGELVVHEGRSTRFDEADLFADYQQAVQSVRARIRP